MLSAFNCLACKKPADCGHTREQADTTTAHGRLIIVVLAGLAEFERELIKSRTGEGRQRAKARGVRMGRKPKLNPHQRKEALARREAGETVVDIARSYAVAHTTILRLKN
jgi:DNA invertase Pin-like site-specific DNA recombinase